MQSSLRHDAALMIKRLLYRASGEPYDVAGKTLRFLPGTRPVRLKYRNSPDAVTRYDALQIELMQNVLKTGDFAIDVGAHAGQYGLIMAALCGPSGRVISFEPDPHAREVLERNIALNRSVAELTVEPIALSNTNCTMTLFSKGGNANSSLSVAAIGGRTPDVEEIAVQTKTLDQYLGIANLPIPRLAKIDTEGAEINILEGASSLLRSDAFIICELHPYAWKEFGKNGRDLQSIVTRFGRRMRYLDQEAELSGEPTYGTVLLERSF